MMMRHRGLSSDSRISRPSHRNGPQRPCRRVLAASSNMSSSVPNEAVLRLIEAGPSTSTSPSLHNLASATRELHVLAAAPAPHQLQDASSGIPPTVWAAGAVAGLALAGGHTPPSPSSNSRVHTHAHARMHTRTHTTNQPTNKTHP